jgi:hypothetical protein
MINTVFHPLFPLDMGPLHYFSVLGRALFTAQHFEMNCRAIAGFLHMREETTFHGSSVLEDPTFQNRMNQLWRKTLGQHVHCLTEQCVLPDDVAPIFKAAVEARNEIAHNVALDVSERFDSELDEGLDCISELVRKIAAADKVASAMIHLLNKDPLPTRTFFESYEDRVVTWVKEDTFED